MERGARYLAPGVVAASEGAVVSSTLASAQEIQR